MSLLSDIQNAAVDNNTDLPTILRKCKVLAYRLRHEPFRQWVEHELNGYNSVDALPDYRILNVQSYGNFVGSFGRSLSEAPIPFNLKCFPDKMRGVMRQSYAMQSISALVSLLQDGTGDKQQPWPADLVVRYGSKIYDDMHCLVAWKLIPRNAIVGIVDTVRNRVLSFVLEIDGAAPESGESAATSARLPQERISQIFHMHIAGDVHNIAAGSSNFAQIASSEVVRGDVKSLISYLAANDVEANDLARLEEALSGVVAAHSDNPFGGKVGEWLSSMLGKAATGGWKIATDAASTLLVKGLSQYFGLSP
jgi:hypothetical protein